MKCYYQQYGKSKKVVNRQRTDWLCMQELSSGKSGLLQKSLDDIRMKETALRERERDEREKESQEERVIVEVIPPADLNRIEKRETT